MPRSRFKALLSFFLSSFSTLTQYLVPQNQKDVVAIVLDDEFLHGVTDLPHIKALPYDELIHATAQVLGLGASP